MIKTPLRIAMAVSVLGLAACQSSGPTTGMAGGTGGGAGVTDAGQFPTRSALPLSSGEARFAEDFRGGIDVGPSTGTAVGERVNELADQVSQLQNSVAAKIDVLQSARQIDAQAANTYYATTAQIASRLQNGTTPGNPELVASWSQASTALETLNQQVTRLNQLSGDVVADNALGGFLLQSIRGTYNLSGAVEADHRALGILEDEVERTIVTVERVLTELTDEITLQSTVLAAERSNLQALQVAISNGEPYGASLLNRAYPTGAAGLSAPNASTISNNLPGDQPLVVVRLGPSDVDYEQVVYEAVAQALERRPEAQFEVYAVSPAQGGPADTSLAANEARDEAVEVLRTLVRLGLPADRVSVNQTQVASVAGAEVRVYVR